MIDDTPTIKGSRAIAGASGKQPIWLLICCLAWGPGWTTAAPSGIHHLDNPRAGPDFVLSDLDGRAHRLSDYQGKVLIVSFWATWCTPCRRELPSLDRTATALHDEGIRVLAINMGETEEEVRQFAARQSLHFPFLPDPDSKVSDAWSVRALPTSYLVDKQGRIVSQVVGGIEWDTETMIQTLRRHAGTISH